tara:strand:+ start:505 stop:630 length:126 start_codon:yes stop_codon:yes gene_type:complete
LNSDVPIHEEHKRKRSKNVFLLFVLLLFIGIVYTITLLKMG